MALHILEKHKAKRILYIKGPEENMESRERALGFMDAVSQIHTKGIEIVTAQGDYWLESGKQAIEEYLKQQQRLPDAVIASNDLMAIGAVKALEKRGYQVPDSVLVTGFDNSMEGQKYIPAITSVGKPLFKIGYEAVGKVLHLSGNTENKEFEVGYFFSESCGCNKKRTDYEIIGRKLVADKVNQLYWEDALKTMLLDLSDADGIDEYLQKLKRHILEFRFQSFYLCLSHYEETFVQEKAVYAEDIVTMEGREHYSKSVYLAIGYENGCFLAPLEFESSKLLPYTRQEEREAYIVVPIHFKKYCFGYCAAQMNEFVMEIMKFQNFIMNISNTLENIRKQTLMQQMIEKLNKMWVFDTLTNVYNRAGFYKYSKELLIGKENQPILLLFIDIDKLKYVNDTFGHEEGDCYIQRVANILMDIRKTNELLMRYGGDEFVILSARGEVSYASECVAQIQRQMTEERNSKYPMSVSVGYHISKVNNNEGLEQLIEAADKEMYKAKKKRREDADGE